MWVDYGRADTVLNPIVLFQLDVPEKEMTAADIRYEIFTSPCKFLHERTKKVLDQMAIQHYDDLQSWKTCRWQRIEVISWVDKGFDTNRDGKLSMEECEWARSYYFKPIEQMFGESCPTVFERCDCDGDGFIDAQDFLNSKYTCLRNCDKATLIWFFIGSRMATDRAFEGIQEADHTIDKNLLKNQ